MLGLRSACACTGGLYQICCALWASLCTPLGNSKTWTGKLFILPPPPPITASSELIVKSFQWVTEKVWDLQDHNHVRNDILLGIHAIVLYGVFNRKCKLLEMNKCSLWAVDSLKKLKVSDYVTRGKITFLSFAYFAIHSEFLYKSL